MLDLLDYRRRVHDIYRNIRASKPTIEAWQVFRAAKDDLYRHHSQTPFDAEQLKTFIALPYFDYDPAFRVLADINTDVEPTEHHLDLGKDGKFTICKFADVHVTLPTGSGVIGLFWIEAYGGGVFLPFRDATNKQTTYGGGRYILDTIKGADLGMEGDKIVLDFNYAYHPSCTYSPRWTCPLAPPENTLLFPVTAGEKLMGT